MIFSGDNLPWSLGMCDKLADGWMQQSCSGGVFMQNFNLPSQLSPFRSTYVRKNDLLYPCDWVGGEVQVLLLPPDHRARPLRDRLRLEADGGDVREARRSRGAASASSPSAATRRAHPRYQPAAAYDYCSSPGPVLADCVYGVVRDFVNNDTNGERAAEFCELVPF